MRTILALLLLAIPALAQAQTSTRISSPISTQEANKAVARRVLDQILSQGKFQVADEIYSRDFLNHGLHHNASLAEDQAAARWEKTVLPDMVVTADLITADQDLVTVVWTLHGTNTVRWGWLPATGVKFEERGITVWRISDGKIHDEWTSFDTLRLARQFVDQLKWKLLAALCVLLILLWLFTRLIRRLWHAIWSKPASPAQH